ncbi:hypothetical protein ACFVJH_22500 [Streptomyces decoyicus]|uniref:hypothetical protein n=1 Tax=Streptomyces decoyicus TaxID=249567 RepID=UPI00362ECA47
MTDTEGAADASDATDPSVTDLSPRDRRKRIADRVPAEGQVRCELAPPADFDLVISAEELPQEERDALQSLGVRYELAAEGSRRE